MPYLVPVEICSSSLFMRYPAWTSLVAQTVKNLSIMQGTWVQSLGQEDPLDEEMATHFSILAWKFHGQRRLVGYSPWGHKKLDTTKQQTLSLTALTVMGVPGNTHTLGKLF